MSTPAVLPADFDKWDQAPPKALPADFNKWDERKPNAGLAPAAGGPASQPMSLDKTGEINPLESSRISPKSNIAKPGETMPEYVGAAGTLGAGAMAASVAEPAIAPIARAGAKFVKAHPIATTLGITAAQEMPGIGPYARKIPSWLPLLAGGKGGSAASETAAEGEEMARPRIPEPAGEAVQAPETMARPPEPLQGTRGVSSYPPEAPQTRAQPIPRTRAEILDDKSVEESVRNATDMEDQQRFRAIREPNLMPSKGELTSAAGAVEKPVKYTKTPGVKSTGPRGISAGTPATDDLTPEWSKALEDVKKRKGK